MSLITIEFFYQNKIAARSAATLFPTPCGGAGKGDTLFHEREYPLFDPPRERFSIAGEQLEELRRLPIALPARGAAALALQDDLPLLLSSAAALPIL